MRKVLPIALLLCAVFLAAQDRVQFKFDTSEADAALDILAKRAANKPIVDADWQRLFGSEPYRRLKKREASMGRGFTEEDFKRYIMSEDLLKRAPELRRTLDSWKKADLQASANRILPYLPASAHVMASVYPMIKPKTNSFVFEVGTDPAIFLYLNPEQSRSEFENVVAHESHHIGFSNASKAYEAKIGSLGANPQEAAKWMGAFGEGLAMLAAAGSADVHPMQDYPADQRMRWDMDVKNWDDDLDELNQYFEDVIGGGFSKPEVADHVAFTFFGYRGPWYTVGYKMGQLVEKHFGRAVLVRCMSDPRILLVKYNQAAKKENESAVTKLPLWSPDVLKAVWDDKESTID